MSIKSDKWIRRMAARARHDRAVRARPGARRRPTAAGSSATAPRATATTSAARRNSRSSRTSTAPSSTRRTSTRRASSTSRPTSASSRRTASRWRARVEYFRIPRNVLTICLGKSTYARCGIIVNVTPFEPEWEGYVTLGVQQHHAAAGQDLRRRGLRAGAVLRERRGLRDQLQGPRRQVPGPAAA